MKDTQQLLLCKQEPIIVVTLRKTTKMTKDIDKLFADIKIYRKLHNIKSMEKFADHINTLLPIPFLPVAKQRYTNWKNKTEEIGDATYCVLRMFLDKYLT